MATFSAAGQVSDTVLLGLRDTLAITLDDGAGTFAGTIELQISSNNFLTYSVAQSWTANASATFRYHDSEFIYARLACTAFTNDTIDYTITRDVAVSDKPHFHQHYIVDKFGNVVMEFTSAGVDVRNGLTIDGVAIGSGGSTVIQPTGIAATDTATLQERLDAHAASEDLTPIVLGAGTFVIDAPLTYAWSSTNWPMPIIQGAGKYATLIQHEASAGGPAFTFEPTASSTFGFGVVFQDLGLRGPSVATPNRHCGLLVRSCWEGTFLRLSIQDFDGYGLRINSDGSGDPYSSKTISIEDCNADNVGEWAIDLGATSLVTSRVIGNYLSSVGGGIWSKMQSGVIEGNGVAYTTLFNGIRIDSRGGANSRITTVRNNAFEGCSKGDVSSYGVITHFQGNQHTDLLSTTQSPGDMFGYRFGFDFDAFSGTADSISAPDGDGLQTVTDASALFTADMVDSTFHIAPSLGGTVGTTNATSHIIMEYVSATQIKIFNPEGTAYSAAPFAYSVGSGVTGAHVEDYTFAIAGSYDTVTSISAPNAGDSNKQTLVVSGPAAFYPSIVGDDITITDSPNVNNNGTFTVTDYVSSASVKYVNAAGGADSSGDARLRPVSTGMNRAITYDAFRIGDSTDNDGVKIGQGYFQVFSGADDNLVKFNYGANAVPREIEHYYGRALGPAKANYAGGSIIGGSTITPDLTEGTIFTYTVYDDPASGVTINAPTVSPQYDGAEIIFRLQNTDIVDQLPCPITWDAKYFAQVGELPEFIPYSSVLWLKFEFYKAGDDYILLERKTPGTTTGLSTVTHKRYAAYLSNTDSFTPDLSQANYFRVDITTATGDVFTINNPDNPPDNPGEELIYRIANSTANPVRLVFGNAYSPGAYTYRQLAPSTFAHFYFRRNLSFLNWYLESYVPSTGPIRGNLQPLLTIPATAASITPVYPTAQNYHIKFTDADSQAAFTINAPTYPPDGNSAFISERGHVIQFELWNLDKSGLAITWDSDYDFGPYLWEDLGLGAQAFLEFEHSYNFTSWKLVKYWRNDDNIAFTNDVEVTGDLTAATVTGGSVTATGTVSGAAVASSQYIRGGLTTGITAYATGGQANATQLANRWNIVETCATAADSVKLPASPTAGDEIYVLNAGAADLAIYPGSGDSIGSMSADTPFYLHPDCRMGFIAMSSSSWRQMSTSIRYITRGDLAANDYTEADLTVMTNTWTDLNLTSKIPASAYDHRCKFRLGVSHASAARAVSLRKNGYSNSFNIAYQSCQSDGAVMHGEWEVASDSNGVIDYRVSATGTVIVLTILGYYVFSM